MSIKPGRKVKKEQSLMIPVERIEKFIFLIRGQKVIVDADLARIYGVSTKVFNQAVKRNEHRFPGDFMFRLTVGKLAAIRSQNVTASKRNIRYPPYVFTEHGAMMAATVLNSETAVAMSVYVVRAFVQFRKILAGNRGLAKKLAELERNLTERLDVHEQAIFKLFEEIREILNPPPPEPPKPKRRVGFHSG